MNLRRRDERSGRSASQPSYHQRERSKNANLDRHQRLRSRRRRQKTPPRRGVALHNFTNPEPRPFRENTSASITQRHGSAKPKQRKSYPIESVRVIAGQHGFKIASRTDGFIAQRTFGAQ